MKKAGLFVLAALMGGVAASLVMISQFKNNNSQITEVKPEVRFVDYTLPGSGSVTTEVVSDFTVAAEKSVNAVVHVWTQRTETYHNPLSYFFGAEPSQRQSLGSGSGVIVSNDGFIVTNNHVVNNADDIKVKLNTGEIMDAKVIGQDPATDLALLKVEAEELPFISYGNSDNIKVGQWVLAVGNPFNLSSTVTAGIVSAKGRNINLLNYDPSTKSFPLESFIQTDAAVNPGNSGGALVGVNGELLGINTAIASNTGSYTGYSFAIPVNIVKKVVNDLYEFGHVQRAFIGVQIRDLSNDLVEYLELKNFDGVYIADLTPGGAAESGGIEKEDVIISVGKVPVKNVTELQEQIGKYRPGDKVSIGLIRDGDKKNVSLVLKNDEGTTELKKPSSIQILDVMGAKLHKASEDELTNLGLSYGVKVKDSGSSFLRKSGMKNGFIITKIDKQTVKNPEQVKSVLNQKKGGGVLIEGYYPDGTKAYYGFGL